MAVTRIKNNQITDATVVASAKLVDYSITAAKIANNLTYGSDLTISGNLTVNGQTTTIDTVSTVIEDPLIVLASNQTGSPSVDIGFIGERGTSDNIAFVWDESASEFVTAFTTDLVTNTTISIASYANFHTNNANIGGNLAVGGNISITGNVTSLNVTGNITGGNLLTPGVVTATGNVTGGNVTTAGQVTATGNITGGNLTTAGITSTGSLSASTTIVATGNITGGNLITGGLASVTGNITGGNLITGGLASVTGNITGGNLTTAGLTSTGTLSSTGNANVGNLGTAGQVIATSNITGGNLTTAGITSTGSLSASTTIAATGNITGGNLITTGITQTGTLTATGNVNGGNIVSSTVTGGAGTLTLNATGDVVFAQSGNINATSSWINNLADPAQAQDAATKQYVDDAVSTGITIHAPVRLESPTDIGGTYAQGGTTATVTDTVAGNTVVFSSAISPQVNDQYWFSNSFNGVVANTPYFVVSAPNTSAAVLSSTYNGAPVSNITSGSGLTQGVRINSGQGATLTNSGANVTLVVDGVTVANTDRILVYQQANAVHNGVYVVSNAGNATSAWQLTRSDDMDTYAPDDIDGLDAGDYFYVQSGDTGAGESYVMTAPIGPTIIGYANLTFTQFSASQVYTANTAAGLALNGTVFSAKVDGITTAFDGGGNISVKASANLTTPNIGAATGTSLNVTGNVTGGNLSAGSGLISTTGNINGAGAVFSGNVTAATFIGNISGNIDAGGANTNIQFNDGDILAGSAAFTFDKTSNAVTASGNITGGNLISNGNILATSAANVTFGDNTWMYTGYTVLNTAGIFHNTGANPDTVQVSTNTLANGIAMWTNGVANSYVTSTGGIEFVTGATLNAYSNPTGGTSTVQITSGGITTGANVTATANVQGANVIGTTSGKFGNIVISGDDITDTNGRVNFNTAGADVDFAVNGDTVANVFYVDAGTGTASFGSATQTTNALVAFNTSTSVLMPVGNTAQRPGTGVTGMLRFNSTTDSLEVYDNAQWSAVGVPIFTVIADEQFNGDGSTVAFTLGSEQTTASCIVSINGVVQLPTVAYSVTSDVLTFTEAPQSGDVIDVRQITTTTTVTAISNSPGTAIVQPNSTLAQTDITGNLIPTANIAYSLGNSTNRWNDLFLSGNTITLGNTVIKNTGGNTIGFFGPDGTTPAPIAASSVDTTTIANGTSSVAVIAVGGNIRANVGGTTVQTISPGLVAITGDLSVSGNATLSGNILGDRVQNGTTSFDIQTPSGNANITVGATSNVAVFSTAGANITGTLGVTGNITGSYIFGNGSQLTGIDATSIQNGTSNVRVVSSGGNVTTSVGGTANVVVVTTTGANITGTLNATGNANVGNLGAATVVATTLTGTLSTAAQTNITSVGTLGALTVTGNVSGGNLITAGLVSTSSIVKTGSNAVGNIGSSSSYFNTVFAQATSALYADLAEKYVADAEYAPGTVVVFGGDKEVTVTSTDADRAVAGVVSTNPSYIMNGGLEAEYVATVALTGRVPCRVTGTVRKGDLMVSAGYGLARAEQDPRVGTVIGKALENHEGADGVIEVVVGRF
jgi:hypothetical protein